MKQEIDFSRAGIIFYTLVSSFMLLNSASLGAYPSFSVVAQILRYAFYAGLALFVFSLAIVVFKVKIKFPVKPSSNFVKSSILAALVTGFIFLAMKTPDVSLEPLQMRISLVLLFAWLGALILTFFSEKRNLIFALGVCLLLFVAALHATNILKGISDYPFSMEWSETSRYYYASLPFAEKLYGIRLPLAFMHPSRYLMLAIAFLFNHDNLEFHRAWQAGLSLIMPALTAVLAAKRVKPANLYHWLLLAGWGFLFLNHGPVYYHLLVSAAIVLAGLKTEKPSAGLGWVMAASAWAGISRINWFPLPGVLAAVIYLLEVPWEEHKGVIWNLRWPVLFGVGGLAVSVAAQLAYVPLSGNSGLKEFGSAFFSDLLWYRLWPNVNFPSGIVPGILTVSILPLLFLIYTLATKKFHWLQRFLLSAALSVFFFGGLVVSVKIGGGSNLHNMDAFLLLVLVMFFYAAKNIQVGNILPRQRNIMAGLLVASMTVSVVWQIQVWVPKFTYNRETADVEIQKLEKDVLREANRGKEILFISQRQFLTFGKLEKVPLVSEYELLTLMEMAMSHNREYLDRFREDLETRRFGLIVAYKQYDIIKGEEEGFAEENNAWVTEISRPLLEYYMPITWLQQSGVQIYAPKRQ